jgi:hypothetical protein
MSNRGNPPGGRGRGGGGGRGGEFNAGSARGIYRYVSTLLLLLRNHIHHDVHPSFQSPFA